MNDRMNKEELVNLIKTLKISKEEFWVVSSGQLTLRGLLDTSGDLDISVTDKGLEELKRNYNLIQKENGWYIINDKIECVCNGKKENLLYQPQKVGEYYVQNIFEYYDYLKGSTRQKDIERIPIVEEYIKNNYSLDSKQWNSLMK